jgi:hypothetical protein
MKKFIWILVVLILATIAYINFGPKSVSGKVVDANNNGVSGVTVRISQRGWGYNDYLVWDKNYFYNTTTDSEGNFRLTYYRGGIDAHLQFYKGRYEENINSVKDLYISFWEHPIVRYP